MSLTVGTGGSQVQVLNESNGNLTLLTRPVLVTEHCSYLNTSGDIVLGDFSQYAIGMKPDLRFESSIHKGFQTDESAFRMISRNDGQPLWDEALTLRDGSHTVSPFVVLEDRS